MDGRQSLLGAIDYWAEKTPSKTALTFLDDAGAEVDALTYSSVLRRSNALASHLLDKLGLVKGSTCLLVYPPCLDFTVAYLACLRAGVIAVPCYPPDPRRLKKDLHMFKAIQGSSGATVALTNRNYNYAKKMADIKGMFSGGASWPELNWVVTDSLASVTAADEDTGRFSVPDPTDVAFIQYTSGSTSEPKGVMITHSNLAHNLKLILAGLSAVDDTVVVAWLPQYHDMGLIGSVLALLFSGGSGFYMSPVSFIKRPALWVELISRHRGTHMQAPNFAYGLTARKFLALDPQPKLDLSCVRHMINAAEPVDTASIDRFYSVFEAHGLKRGVIFPTYGLAEHTVYVCSNGKDRLVVDRVMLETERKVRPVDNKLELWAYGMDGAGTVGGKDDGVLTTVVVGCGRPKESDGVDLRIVDTEIHSALPEGNVGEIWVTSKSRAAGYWSQPEKTAEAFGGRLANDGDGPAPAAEGSVGHGAPVDGYLKTGDLGFLWEGELYICGRIKDLIIVRGRNHYPQDLERTAEGAVAGSLRGGCSAAFGLAGADGGESLAIVAEVQHVGARFDGQALAAEIRKVVAAEHGASLAMVRLLRPRTIPKTTSGKISRTMCKKAHASGALDGDTVFLWGDDRMASHLSSAPGTAKDQTTVAEMDAQAERDETGGSGSSAAGTEESKSSGGGKGCPADMTVADILKGVQSEVAKILKADASAIPMDAPLATLGLDSMEAMQLMSLLEERFSVTIPDEVMFEPDTTLMTLAPIIKAGGVVPERARAIDCGLLAAMEAKEGPPKGYMAEETVQKMQTRRLTECSFKTQLGTGKFKEGCLSEQAEMSTADVVLVRSFFCLYAAVDVLTPLFLAGLLLLSLAPLAALLEESQSQAAVPVLSSVVKRLFVLYVVCVKGTALVKSYCSRFPPAGRHSRLRACVMKYLGVRVVVEGKQEPGVIYIYAGVGPAEQLLLSSAAPSALSRPIRPTTTAVICPSLAHTVLLSLLGSASVEKTHDWAALDCAAEAGESACTSGGETELALAPAVSTAMKRGAQIVPCTVLGSSGVDGRFALAKAAAAWGLWKRPGGVVVVCARPVAVPSTEDSASMLKYAETVQAAAARVRSEHCNAFFTG
ncbi:unnamed protein product [Ectocarpus sp. CCAP 1310/34]|nr:unnamed protein product [Ectocarpus sp. CCAP 1310/34]